MEFWERFAMYGVKSLLVVILLDRILTGDLSHVAGAAMVRDASAALFGPVSRTGLASQLYGYANALLYLSIPFGGLVGDLLGSRRAAVACGGAGMLAGLALMLREHSFLIGLVPFAIGTGLLKGNLSVQIGMLFRDEAQRRRGFTVYLGFLNAGVICGPLLCGAVAAYAGPTYAIAVAAAAVAIGLFFYARRAGRNDMAEPAPVRAAPANAPIPATAMLIVTMVAVYLCFAAYEQLGNIFLVWARARVDLNLAGWTMPVAWFLSLDGLVTLGLIAVWQMVLRLLDRRGIAVGAVMQIFAGALLCAGGYIVLAIGSAYGGTLSLPWALSYLVLVDAAIVLIWPSGLSVIAETAPRRLVGLWTGLFYLHGFFAHLWVGMIGIYYERVPTPLFWLLHAAMAGGGALLVLIAGIPMLRVLRARQAITTSA
ncbi:MFS transporter [Stakelama saccharophila]|uniref:MFS transporter n=1 Tax=Stakelama saccharophila TaxID=3075605 RepID=A0ABZ0BCY3_9SPHN|nr:MFS transporter [Stakelama sp. W311]WNO55197.1 MFS transporter [Stakelama sp. W311]